MRRFLFSPAAIAVALITVTASPVFAAGPDHLRNEPAPPVTIAAGEACDFAVTIVNAETASTTSTWELPDGTFRVVDRGFADSYAEGPEGARVSLRGGYRTEILFHPDGSVDVKGSGSHFVVYLEGDPIIGLAAPGAYTVRGNGTESYAPNGSLVSARFFGGQVTDLCEALAAQD